MASRKPLVFQSKLCFFEIKSFEELIARVKKLERNVGQSSGPAMERRMKEILAVCPDVDNMISVLRSRGHIRPMTRLWFQREANEVPFDARILQRIEHLVESCRAKRMGRLALREMRDLFFQKYDPQIPFYGQLGDFLIAQLGKYEAREVSLGLDQLKEHVELLRLGGHAALAKLATAREVSLPKLLDLFGIPIEGRFFALAAREYYVDRINLLAPNEDSPLLNEIQAREVYRAPLGNGVLVGHEVLKALIDKLILAGEEPSERWHDIILSIAGDPRVPRTHENYTLWWSHLGRERMNAMLGWLSKVDLELFLQILEEFASREGKEDIQRMLPQRIKLLRALDAKHFIKSSRLFLSRKPAAYVDNVLRDKKAKIAYTNIETNQSNDLSALYLNLGTAHLVEGTHNFKLRIFDRLPQDSILLTYPDSVTRQEISNNLEQNYSKTFPIQNFFSKIHHRNWIKHVIPKLNELGIPLRPSDLETLDQHLKGGVR